MNKFCLKLIITVALFFVVYSCSSKNKSIISSGATPVQVSGDFLFTEGPAIDTDGNVYFTDQPNNRIMKWTLNGEIIVFMDNCGRSNGLYFDENGFLIACADENNELWSINTETKEVKVLIDNYEGQRLNGPNDLWISPTGGLYFTDPNYKRSYWKDSLVQIESQNVYFLTPDRKTLSVVDANFLKPNGIIGSPDGETLYVSDREANRTYKFHIEKDGSLSGKTMFCEMGSDGMTMDEKGNVYLTNHGVFIYNKEGEQIEHIAINEKWTANVTFCGIDRKTLFITAMNSVYTLKMNVKGAR